MTPLIVVGVIVLVGLFIAALARSGFISAGEAGERAVSAILREDLDQHRYKVLDNIMLKTNKGITTQIDHIVVSRDIRGSDPSKYAQSVSGRGRHFRRNLQLTAPADRTLVSPAGAP